MNYYQGFCERCVKDLDRCYKCDYFNNGKPINFTQSPFKPSPYIKETSKLKCPHCSRTTETTTFDLVRNSFDMSGEQDRHFMVEMYQCCDCLGYFNIYLDITKIVALKEVE